MSKLDEKLRIIIDEKGMSLWCRGGAYLINNKGQRCIAGLPPRKLDKDERIKFIELAQKQKNYLLEQLKETEETIEILKNLD